MQKINFEDYPSTNTPIDADNLNDLQDNVEQSINGIIEEGSNTNGTYIKFANGTMICYKSVTANVAMTNSWGSLFDGSMNLGNWPQAFIDVPNVQITNPSGIGAMIENMDPVPTRTNIGTVFLARGYAMTANITINVLGIGKWK